MKSSHWIALFSLIFTPSLWAHGENKRGPHGGYIRMPGAFHTELVQTSPTELRVYLLDMNFKNATTADSSVSGQIRYAKGLVSLDCGAKADHFVCILPESASMENATEIVLKARRAGVAGAPATYSYPLKLNGHSGH